MLCCCCYLCKVNIGILLPEPTLVPLGGGKGWTGYSVQDASNCPASEGTSLQEAKLSLQVAFLLELSGVMPLNPLLDSAFLLLNAHGLRTYPSTALQFTAQQEAQLETETSQHFHTLQLETSWHPEAWFMFSFSIPSLSIALQTQVQMHNMLGWHCITGHDLPEPLLRHSW